MSSTRHTIRTFATVGLVLKVISMAAQIVVRLIPKPVLSIFMRVSPDLSDSMQAIHNPFVYAGLLGSFAICLTFYLVLISQQESKNEMACLITVICLAVSCFIWPVCQYVLSTVGNVWLGRFYGLEELAVSRTLSTIDGVISLISGPAIPLLAIAAGMNLQRCKSENAMSKE
ncbi:MAG: hypothetical protein MJ071_02215 [Oscillospiraceae bacterium]|nr:hypothetical protein [Oscillospiraceae bacterium]